MIETPEGKFYSVPEVSKILGCSFQYVRKLINGRYRTYKNYKLFEKPIVDQSFVRHVRKDSHKRIRYMVHEDAVKSLVDKKLQKIKNNALILS